MSSNQSGQTRANKQSRKKYKQEKKAANKNQQEQELIAGDAETRKQQKVKRKEAKRQNKKPRRRILPIWLRLIIVLFLTFIATVTGLMIGYGMIGDGVPAEVLKKETWQHIVNFIKEK